MTRGRARKSLPLALARAQDRFEEWRRSRTGRRIPGKLWVAAARLAARHGVQRTATALRLNSAVLKSHMTVDPVLAAGTSVTPEAPQFVELLGSPGEQGSAELTDGQGARMRVEWRGAMPDLAALSRGFFGRAS